MWTCKTAIYSSSSCQMVWDVSEKNVSFVGTRSFGPHTQSYPRTRGRILRCWYSYLMSGSTTNLFLTLKTVHRGYYKDPSSDFIPFKYSQEVIKERNHPTSESYFVLLYPLQHTTNVVGGVVNQRGSRSSSKEGTHLEVHLGSICLEKNFLVYHL